MYHAEYLLSIREFLTEESGEALVERAFSCIDKERKRKAEKIRPGRAGAASLGAGLRLPLGAGEALRGAGARESAGAPCAAYSVREVLKRLEELPGQFLTYRYGENGKPYFRELPFYFSLSHSGDYVFCVLSVEEVGADIQQHRRNFKAGNRRHLADRFFSEEERRALEDSEESEVLFYRLWARKEALGKLTGKGVAGILNVNLLPEEGTLSRDGVSPGNVRLSGDGGRASQQKEEPVRERILLPGRQLVWKEYSDIAGYSIAVCHVTA